MKGSMAFSRSPPSVPTPCRIWSSFLFSRFLGTSQNSLKSLQRTEDKIEAPSHINIQKRKLAIPNNTPGSLDSSPSSLSSFNSNEVCPQALWWVTRLQRPLLRGGASSMLQHKTGLDLLALFRRLSFFVVTEGNLRRCLVMALQCSNKRLQSWRGLKAHRLVAESLTSRVGVV